MSKPLVLINFKTYSEAVGDKAVILAKKIAQVKSIKYQIAIAPSLLDLQQVSAVNIPVFAQHTDGTLGSHTGSIPIEELKKLGVAGTLLNHSEKKIPFEKIKETVNLCKNKNFPVIVCTSTIEETKKIASLEPDYIAYEPPELIGGNISVIEAKPEIIVKAVEAVKKVTTKTKVLCGAGVQTKEDIPGAIKLGTHGVLIGHAVPKANNPKEYLEGMLG